MTTNDMVSLRPLVVFAIRMMAPGRRRVEMVKLAHDLNDARSYAAQPPGGLQVAVDRDRHAQALPSHRRAA